MFDFWVGVLFLIFFGDDLGVSTSFLASFLSRCCHLKNSLLEDAKIMFHVSKDEVPIFKKKVLRAPRESKGISYRNKAHQYIDGL